MAVTETSDLKKYCLEVARRAKAAAFELGQVTSALKSRWLKRSASLVRQQSDALRQANQHDLDGAPQFGLSEAQVDRLRLTPD